MTDTIDVAALVERLRDESRALSWLSIERGSAEAGIASNLADEAATALQSQADALAEARRDLAEARLTIGRLYEMMPEDGK